MATLLKGAPVAAALNEESKKICDGLLALGVVPTLAVVRIGGRQDDLSYERGLKKRAQELGIAVIIRALSDGIKASEYYDAVTALARDPSVHGILLFRPLPSYINEAHACSLIPADKDVDGCTKANLGRCFTGDLSGLLPCTAQAALELLKYYRVPLAGANACVIGRSLVIGRPISMLLLAENATVTICHSKTKAAAAIAKRADIVVAACGKPRAIDSSYIKEGATVIDVGIHFDGACGTPSGDVDFESAKDLAAAITPVPGGVGSVTTAVLMRHVAGAAEAAKNL